MEIFKQLEALVTAKLTIFKTVFKLVRLEAKLAGLSILPLVLSICMLLVLLMSTWMMISVLAVYGIVLLVNSYLAGFSIILLVNLCLSWAMFRYLNYNLNSMSFVKTRAYFSQKKRIYYESNQKTVAVRADTSGNNIKPTTTSSEL